MDVIILLCILMYLLGAHFVLAIQFDFITIYLSFKIFQYQILKKSFNSELLNKYALKSRKQNNF